MSSEHFNKKNVSLISISTIIILSLSLSVDARVAVSDSTNSILQHEASESPHLGTDTQLKYISEDITEIKTDVTTLNESMQKLLRIIFRTTC